MSGQVKESSAKYQVIRHSREDVNSIEVGVPPGYKQTEVGVIPQAWIVSSIGSLCSITTGSKNTQ